MTAGTVTVAGRAYCVPEAEGFEAGVDVPVAGCAEKGKDGRGGSGGGNGGWDGDRDGQRMSETFGMSANENAEAEADAANDTGDNDGDDDDDGNNNDNADSMSLRRVRQVRKLDDAFSVLVCQSSTRSSRAPHNS